MGDADFSLAGPQCGARASCAIPAQFCSALRSALADLAVGASSRAHVRGRSVCLGLSGPVQKPGVNTLHGTANESLVLINSVFSWASARLGASIGWTSIQLNVDTVADWHVDVGNIGLSMMIVLGDFSGGEFEIGDSGPLQLNGKAVLFGGQEHHRSLPARGQRWSLVAFTSYVSKSCPANLKRKMLALGFPGGSPEVPRPIRVRLFLDLCAGASAPLSFAVAASGKACAWPMDASPRVGGHWHDILVPEVAWLLRRVCASGNVAFASAGPPCSDYSRLRALPQGPPPVRDRDNLQGWPGMAPWMIDQVQTSHAIHTAVADLLQLVVDSGGHFAWENPPSSLALHEPRIQELFKSTRCDFVIILACNYGVDMAKKWLFATTWPPLLELGHHCQHNYKHKSLMGKNSQGLWNSAASAVYPADFAVALATVVAPLLASGNGQFTDWWSIVGVPPPDQALRLSCFAQPDDKVVDVRRAPGGAAFPHSYGNPFKLQQFPRASCLAKFRELVADSKKVLADLRGKTLCCSCRDHEQCHADILTKVANEQSLPVLVAEDPPPPSELRRRGWDP